MIKCSFDRIGVFLDNYVHDRFMGYLKKNIREPCFEGRDFFQQKMGIRTMCFFDKILAREQ